MSPRTEVCMAGILAVVVMFAVIFDLGGGDAAADEGEKKTGTISGTLKTKPKKYAKWAVVHLKEVKGAWPVPEEHAKIDQKNLEFKPHVLPVVKGTTVDFLNSDSVAHNVFSPKKYNLGTWPQGKKKSHKFDDLGAHVQLCNVHPEMEAWVLVLQNPFFTVVGEDGAFELSGVPPGEYTLVAWSERLKGAETVVKVEAGKTLKHEFSLKGKK